jgi:hypothetical protein
VLKLIRMWLGTLVVVPVEEGKPKRLSRPRKRPQGGPISPLLRNLRPHWFDKLFHRTDGPVGKAILTYITLANRGAIERDSYFRTAHRALSKLTACRQLTNP